MAESKGPAHFKKPVQRGGGKRGCTVRQKHALNREGAAPQKRGTPGKQTKRFIPVETRKNGPLRGIANKINKANPCGPAREEDPLILFQKEGRSNTNTPGQPVVKKKKDHPHTDSLIQKSPPRPTKRVPHKTN